MRAAPSCPGTRLTTITSCIHAYMHLLLRAHFDPIMYYGELRYLRYCILVIISTSNPFVRRRIADTAVPRSIHKYRNTDISVAEAVSYNNC